MLQSTQTIEYTLEDKLRTFPRIDYGIETVTCGQKYQLWERIGFTRAEDMIKSVLIAYQKGRQERHILVCTTGKSEIDFREVAYELSLSDEEAETLTARLFDYEIEEITGKKRGEVSPLIEESRLEGLEVVYFTRELMRISDKIYDVPLSLRESVLVSAADLFSILKERSSKYKTFSHDGSYRFKDDKKPDTADDFKFSVLDGWRKVRKEGEKFSFYGTKIIHGSDTYILKQPRTKKTDSKSKKEGCIAVLLDEDGKKVKREDGREYRTILPVSYGLVEQMYKTHLFRKSSADWFTRQKFISRKE